MLLRLNALNQPIVTAGMLNLARSDNTIFTIWEREFERQAEMLRRNREAEERQKKSPLGLFTGFLDNARDLLDRVHKKLALAESYSLSTPSHIDDWLSEMRTWLCEIDDALEVYWSSTPVALLSRVTAFYTKCWWRLKLCFDKLMELDRDVDAVLAFLERS
jgi:hypothetical protein